MDFTGAGTAIMLALAAVLWFLYLLPSWMRRREFLATERNATRLQRAIRVMAESAEAPAELHVEANAREAARTERLLAQERRRADAVARAEVHAAALRARAAETHAAELARAARRPAPAPAIARGRAIGAVRSTPVSQFSPSQASVPQVPVALAFGRLRRARRVAGLLLLAAVIVGAAQLWLMATTGIVLGSWLVIGGCVIAAGASVRLQRRIADRARSLASAPAAPVRRAAASLVDAELPAAAPERAWTPVPVPKPLYLERGEAPRVPVVPAVSAEALLRAAAEEAERALAAAHAEPEVVRFRPREAPPAPAVAPAPVSAPAPSRFASMGIVDEVDVASPDLDEVLRRRRSVG
jgi:hypothetical protein